MSPTDPAKDRPEEDPPGQQPAHATRPTARAKPPPGRHRRTRKPVTVGFAHDPEQPTLIQAASLALSVLSWTKAGTVGNLDRLLEAGDPGTTGLVAAVRLTTAQVALLDATEHSGALAALRCPPDFTATPVTVQVCRECGRWSLTHGSAVRSCRMTAGCQGTVVRAGRAKRTKPQAEQPASADSTEPAVNT